MPDLRAQQSYFHVYTVLRDQRCIQVAEQPAKRLARLPAEHAVLVAGRLRMYEFVLPEVTCLGGTIYSLTEDTGLPGGQHML